MDASVISLIGGLGSATAAVVVTYLFLQGQSSNYRMVQDHSDAVFEQLKQIVVDKGVIIKENTRALEQLERTCATLQETVLTNRALIQQMLDNRGHPHD